MVVIIYGFSASSFLVLGTISNMKDFNTLRGSITKQRSTDYGEAWVVSNAKKDIVTMFLKTREDAEVYKSPAEYELFLNPEKVSPTKIKTKKVAKKSAAPAKKATSGKKTTTKAPASKKAPAKPKKEIPVMGKDAMARDEQAKMAIQDFINDREDDIEKFVTTFVKRGVLYSDLKNFLSTLIKTPVIYDHYSMSAHNYIAVIRKKHYDQASHVSALDITLSDILRPFYSENDDSVLKKTLAWMKTYDPKDFLLPTRKTAKKATKAKEASPKKPASKKTAAAATKAKVAAPKKATPKAAAKAKASSPKKASAPKVAAPKAAPKAKSPAPKKAAPKATKAKATAPKVASPKKKVAEPKAKAPAAKKAAPKKKVAKKTTKAAKKTVAKKK